MIIEHVILVMYSDNQASKNTEVDSLRELECTLNSNEIYIESRFLISKCAFYVCLYMLVS